MQNRFWVAVGATFLLAAVIVVALAALTRPQGGVSTDRPIVLYCAAGIRPPVEKAIQEYKKEFGVQVDITADGSGKLLGTIKTADRGDLYLAADEHYIEQAQKMDLVREAFPLATQRAVIAVQKGNPRNITSLESLLNPELKIGLANPDATAVGKTTREIFKATGQWDAFQQCVEQNGVSTLTVVELANDLKLGAIDAAIMWDATVNQYPELDMVSITETPISEKHIILGVLNASKQPSQALHLARYLSARDRGLKHFTAEHYDPVDGDLWADLPKVTLHVGGVLAPAVEKTLAEFQEREGVEITTVINGCGILVASMKAGERPDGYLACDRSFMVQVEDLFLDPIDVCQTGYVICVPKGNPRGIASLKDLDAEGLRLGVCHPEQSALGALTAAFLKAQGLDRVLADNVKVESPTADFLIAQMQTDHLDAAIVFWANYYRVRDKLDHVPLDESSGVAVQPLAIGKNSGYKFLMTRLVARLVSEQSSRRFIDSGFDWLVAKGPEQDESL
jgi:ABC-type molybdate transport system substrate-binding protein